MPNVPAVSVIIPLYNAEKYISECLDSLLAQTFPNFEVIIVNDCSPDSSRTIAESYLDKFDGRLKLLDNEKNSGPGASRNNGLRQATGEYIFFMDSDDLLIPTGLEEMHTPAKEFDADVVYCEKFFSADDTGKIFQTADTRGTRLVTEPTLEPDSLADRVNFITRRSFFGTPWIKLVRRKMLIENEIVFPHFPLTEDHFWSCGLFFFAKKFLRIPKAVYIYRHTKVSVTRGEQNPVRGVIKWLNGVIFGLKFLDDMMGRLEFFRQNSQYRYAMLLYIASGGINSASWRGAKFQRSLIYEGIKNDFGDSLGEHDVLISMLCTIAMDYKQDIINKHKRIAELEEQLKAK